MGLHLVTPQSPRASSDLGVTHNLPTFSQGLILGTLVEVTQN